VEHYRPTVDTLTTGGVLVEVKLRTSTPSRLPLWPSGHARAPRGIPRLCVPLKRWEFERRYEPQ